VTTAESPARSGTSETKASVDAANSDARSTTNPLSKRQGTKIDKGGWVWEHGKLYDESLLRAMYRTIRKRWWIAIVLKCAGGTSRLD